MKKHEILWILSFLKMGINIAGMPIKWIVKNSRIWTVRLTTNDYHRITTDKKVRIIKD